MNRFVRPAFALVSMLLALHAPVGLATEIVVPDQCSADDASVCIQDAINKAEGLKTAVVITPGTYTLLHPIRLASGVSIFGTSDTILQPSPRNTEGVLLVYGAKVAGVRVEGITFDGGGKDFPVESFLIDLDGTQDVVFDAVTLRHSRATAFAVLGNNGSASSGNGIQNSHIFDVGNHWRTTLKTSGRKMGIQFWDEAPLQSSGNFARHNRFEDIGLDAIQVAGQQGFVGEENFFALDNGQRELLKAGDYPAAFFAETSSDLAIRNNTIRGALGNCIDMPGVTGALIEGNLIVGCGQSGIGVFQDYDFDKVSSSNVVIRNNVILNSAVWPPSCWNAGITIANGRPSDIRIADNIITDLRPKGKKTQDYGIQVANGECGATTKLKGLVIEAGNRLEGNQRARTHGIP